MFYIQLDILNIVLFDNETETVRTYVLFKGKHLLNIYWIIAF